MFDGFIPAESVLKVKTYFRKLKVEKKKRKKKFKTEETRQVLGNIIYKEKRKKRFKCYG